MKQQNILFGAITFVLLSMAIVSATNIIAGESYTFSIPEEYSYYSIVGNSTDIDLNITQEGLNVTITIGKYTQSDSFTLILFNPEKEIITEHHYSSGGGGGTRTIYRDKNVTEYKVIESKGEKEIVTETVTETVTEIKYLVWVWVIVGILFLIVVIGIVIYFKNGVEETEAVVEPQNNYNSG